MTEDYNSYIDELLTRGSFSGAPDFNEICNHTIFICEDANFVEIARSRLRYKEIYVAEVHEDPSMPSRNVHSILLTSESVRRTLEIWDKINSTIPKPLPPESAVRGDFAGHQRFVVRCSLLQIIDDIAGLVDESDDRELSDKVLEATECVTRGLGQFTPLNGTKSLQYGSAFLTVQKRVWRKFRFLVRFPVFIYIHICS